MTYWTLPIVTESWQSVMFAALGPAVEIIQEQSVMRSCCPACPVLMAEVENTSRDYMHSQTSSALHS